MKKIQALVFAGVLLICFSSCTVPSYVQTTPSIPVLEEQYDFEISISPPLINLSTPELLPRGEIQASYAPFENIFVQGSFLLGLSAESTSILNWDIHQFKQIDYSLGAGYFIMLDEHHFSVSAGYGGGQLNNAKSWNQFFNNQIRNLRASYALYNRLYLQGGYVVDIHESFSIGIGLRYEINHYNQLRLLNASFDSVENTRENLELDEWKDQKLMVFSPVVSLTRKFPGSPLSSFLKIGSSNMQNWNDIHVNKSFVVLGITFSPDYN